MSSLPYFAPFTGQMVDAAVGEVPVLRKDVDRLTTLDALTGGVEGALDSVDTTALAVGVKALAVDDGLFYFYQLETDAAAEESSPEVILPDDFHASTNPKAWKLKGLGASSTGTVAGPETSTDNAIARYSGTEGQTIQDSPVLIDDDGNIVMTAGSRLTLGVNNATISMIGGASKTDAAYIEMSGDSHETTPGDVTARIKGSGVFKITHAAFGSLDQTTVMSIGQTSASFVGSLQVKSLSLSGNTSQASWTTTGVALNVAPSSHNDSTGSGSVSTRVANSFGAATFTSDSAITVNNAFLLRVSLPIAGDGVTFGKAHSAYFEGNVGIGSITPNILGTFGTALTVTATGGSAGLELQGENTLGGQQLAMIAFWNSSTALRVASILCRTGSNDSAGSMEFYVTDSAGGQIRVLRVTEEAGFAIGPTSLPTNYGQVHRASGSFAVPGDVGASHLTARASTTDDSAGVELFLDGVSKRCVIPGNTSWYFTVVIVARDDATGDTDAWEFKGMIKNNGGSTSLGLFSSLKIANDSADAWSATVVANDTNDALQPQVQGDASKDIFWSADIYLVHVTK